MLLRSRPFHWHATLWPSNDRVCIVLRNIHLCWKIRRKIFLKSGFNAGSAFPSCCFIVIFKTHSANCFDVLCFDVLCFLFYGWLRAVIIDLYNIWRSRCDSHYQLFTYYDAMCAINKSRFVDYICCLYMAY